MVQTLKKIVYRSLVCLICSINIHISSAQEFVSGTVKDQTSGRGIPFVAMGISAKGMGTVTDQYGNFKLSIHSFLISDTIQVSAIGYKTLFIPVSSIKLQKDHEILLEPMVYDLAEIKIKPKKYFSAILGTSQYSKTNCSAFQGKNGNWKGEQAAIIANNPQDVTVQFESFSFYIIKNLYEDSLQFRVMLYSAGDDGKPGASFLRSPILFKTNAKQGEVTIDLKSYDISTKGNFFISLECLEDEMDVSKFCFAGSIKVPSYFKSAFGRWGKVKGGGGDFNVKVKCSK